MTGTSGTAARDPIAAAVAEIAVIERVRGVLMVVYDIDADAALDLLKWRSQHTNTELRVLANRLITDFRLLQWREEGMPRLAFDRLFRTAHQRVEA